MAQEQAAAALADRWTKILDSSFYFQTSHRDRLAEHAVLAEPWEGVKYT